ncbi:MAG: pantoate--beta-alanine ligase [Sphingobacteriaceae bacterium]
MKIFSTRADLSSHLKKIKLAGKRIGFVPTMGALHAGHLSLIELARKHADVVVCSIFVNPTQFNDPKDLERYPRPIQKDTQALEQALCDVLFIPEVSEMYSAAEKWHIHLEGLDELLEGKQRPGHYQGVTQIVKKLFDCVQPDIVFFGQKDFQQFLVISKMVKKFRLKLELMMCPIIREKDGLAMSSRNTHLSPIERKNALALYQTLKQIKNSYQKQSIAELKKEAICKLQESSGVELEYFEICHTENLKPALSKKAKHLVALVAARLGQTRLIDNMILK